ncbi:MAG: amidohydrolase family protein [Steroidobacteraceae bacterium]
MATPASRVHTPVASKIPIFDIDTHWAEPADLWTSRAPAKYKDKVIHIKEKKDGSQVWMVNDRQIGMAGPSVIDKNLNKVYQVTSIARFDQMADASYDAKARLKVMDSYNVGTQIVYPNVIGFGAQTLMALSNDVELRQWHITAYNDALAELQKAGEGRLLPQAALPLWDIDASLKELHRAREKLGLTGIVMSDNPDHFGQKPLTDPTWDRFFATCQDLELPINFHIASGSSWEGDLSAWWEEDKTMIREDRTLNGPLCVFQGLKLFMNNVNDISNLILTGILEKYPRLKFVSVESGASWIPFVVQSIEHYFGEVMTPAERARFSRTPTQMFRDQIFASYWFENRNAVDFFVKEFGGDNLMFETDFPHPNSLYPDVAGKIDESLGWLDEETRRKILYKNAERVYGVPVAGIGKK